MIELERNSLKFRNDNARNGLNIKVQTHPKRNLLNLELTPLAELIAKPYYLQPIELDLNKRTVEIGMTDYTISKFSGNYTLKYELWNLKTFVKYSFPIINGKDLLFHATQNREIPEFIKFINLSKAKERLELVYQTNHPEKELTEEIKGEIKDSTEKVIESIKKVTMEIEREAESFNHSMTEYTLGLLKKRKNKLESDIQQADDMNDF